MPKGKKAREERAPKQKQTDLSQAEINRRRRRDNLMRLLIDNFGPGDRYLTLTYKDKPPGVDEIKEDVRKLKRQLKAKYKRLGVELKYAGIIENLYGGGRPHVHLLINTAEGLPVKQIERMWGHGFAKSQEYGGEPEDARKLSDYFTKARTEDVSSGLQTSRNLIRTEPKKEEVRRSSSFREKIRPPAGYIEIQLEGWSGSWYTEEGFLMVRAVFVRVDDVARGAPRKKKGEST